MPTERTFQRSYMAALKAAVKEKRQASGGLKLSEAERRSVRLDASSAAEKKELAETGAVVKSTIRKPKYGYVVATDTALSGWGKAPRTSFYAIAVDNAKEADIVIQNMTSRSEMKRVRFQATLPKVTRGQHLHVVDKKQARRFFEIGEGGFDPDPKQAKKVVKANYGPRFVEGYEACLKGIPESKNPYKQWSEYLRIEWSEGWRYCNNILGVQKE